MGRQFTTVYDFDDNYVAWVKHLKEKENTIMASGVIALEVIERPGLAPLIQFHVEDDGSLGKSILVLDASWLDSLVETITKTKKFIKKHKLDHSPRNIK